MRRVRGDNAGGYRPQLLTDRYESPKGANLVSPIITTVDNFAIVNWAEPWSKLQVPLALDGVGTSRNHDSFLKASRYEVEI